MKHASEQGGEAAKGATPSESRDFGRSVKGERKGLARPSAEIPIPWLATWGLVLVLFMLCAWMGIGYAGDDRLVIRKSMGIDPLVMDSIRPLEVLVAFIAGRSFDSFWFLASAAFHVANAFVTRELAALVLGRSYSLLIFLVASPLLAQLLGQIDTVSQSSGNFFFWLGMWSLLRWHRQGQSKDLGLCVVAGALAMFSKETLVAAPCLSLLAIFLRPPAKRASLFAVLLAFFALMASYAGLKMSGGGIGAGLAASADSRYALKFDPRTWAKNFVFLLAACSNPLPTSVIGLRGNWSLAWTAIGTMSAGGVLIFLAQLLRRRELRPLLVGFLFAAAPLVFVHCSELYASVVTPLFVISLLRVHERWPRGRALLCAWIAGLVLASTVNVFVLSSIRCSSGQCCEHEPQCRLLGTVSANWKNADYSLYQTPLRPYYGASLTKARALLARKAKREANRRGRRAR